MNQIPELPEGYFFRVKPTIFDALRIDLRKKLRWGSRCIEWNVTYPNDEAVLRAMNRLKAENFTPQPPDPRNPYCGDYPPKTLGDTNDA